MNGLVLKDKELVQKMDSSLVSIPVSFNKDGSFRKNSSVASKEQFDILNRYVKTKISHIRQSIMTGDAQVSPYMMGKKMPVPTVLTAAYAVLTWKFQAMNSAG